MTFRPPRIVLVVDVLGGLLMAGVILTGVAVLTGDLDLSQTTTSERASARGWAEDLLDRAPAAVQGGIFVVVGLVVLLVTWREFLVNAGWRSWLEYEEKADGIELSSYGHRRLLPPKRFLVPRRSYVVLVVQRELPSNYGTIRNRSVVVFVDGRAAASVYIPARRDEEPFQRVSFAPLRDIVERQGGAVLAQDPAFAVTLFSPARSRRAARR